MIAANGVVCTIPRIKKGTIAAAGSAHTQTLGPDRRACRRAGRGALPVNPDPKALEQFLISAKAADPLRFPDLSLSIVKLLGAGKYVVELPGDAAPGHFGLAVKDYAHSTAPNRRYPDLITQRLLKAAMAEMPSPTGTRNWKRLQSTAPKRKTQPETKNGRSGNPQLQYCWNQESGRNSTPSSPAQPIKARGFVFWIHPPKPHWRRGFKGLDVGQRLRVQLVRTDVERGYIDFKKVA